MNTVLFNNSVDEAEAVESLLDTIAVDGKWLDVLPVELLTVLSDVEIVSSIPLERNV